MRQVRWRLPPCGSRSSRLVEAEFPVKCVSCFMPKIVKYDYGRFEECLSFGWHMIENFGKSFDDGIWAREE